MGCITSLVVLAGHDEVYNVLQVSAQVIDVYQVKAWDMEI